MLNQDALQPHRVVEIIDRAFRIYRDQFLTFVGLSAVVLVPLTLAQTAITNTLSASVQFPEANAAVSANPSATLLFLVASVAALVLQGVMLNGALTYIASEQYLGRRVSASEAFQAIGSRFVPLGVGLVTFGLLVFIAVYLVVVAGAILLCPLLLLPVVLYLASAGYYFIVPVLTLENVPAMAGIRRALMLGKRRFWPAFWLVLGVNFILLVIALVVGLLFGTLLGGSANADLLTGQTSLAGIVLQVGLNVLVVPILPIALTVMYYDARVRLEGLDIVLQSAATAAPRPADVHSPPSDDPILGGQDVTNIVLLTFGIIGLTFALSFITFNLLGPQINDMFADILATLGTPQQ